MTNKKAGEIQGEICKIQEADILFDKQVKKINKLLNKWKNDIYDKGVRDTHRKLINGRSYKKK
jgi:hypothetical protein